MKIALIDSKIDNPNAYIVSEIYSAFMAREGAGNVFLCSYNDLIETINNESIDFLLVLDGNMINNPIIKKACGLVRYAYCWRFDDPYDFQSLEFTKNWFNHIYTNDAQTAQDQKDFTYLPLSGFSNSDISFSSLEKRPFDILFVGTVWPNRKPYLEALKNLTQAYNCNLISNHIEFQSDEVFNYSNGLSFFPRIGISDYKFFLENTKIVVSLGRDFSVGESNKSISVGLPPRVFEALSYGCIQITDEIISKSPYFSDFSTFYVCSNANDLETMLGELIENITDHNNYVTKDLAKYRTSHTYLNRINLIMDKHYQLVNEVGENQFEDYSVFNILHVSNNDLSESENPLGGSDYWLKTILDDKDLKFRHYLFSPTKDFTGFQVSNAEETVPLLSELFKTQWDVRDRLLEKSFAKYIVDNNINLVHFNHLLNIPLSLIKICKLLGVKTAITWHDFYGICPNFILYNQTTGYCGYLENSEVNHDTCLTSSLGLPPGSWDRRKWVISKLISEVPNHIFPSDFAAKSYLQAFPSISKLNRFIVKPPLPLLSKFAPRISEKGRARKYLAFIGNVSAHKGSAFISELANIIDRREHQILIVGHTDYPNLRLEELGILGPFNYNPENLENLTEYINDILVVVAISQWPETYQITVDEFSSMGIPVLVSNLGAPSERSQLNNFIIPVPFNITSGDLYKTILNLHKTHPGVNIPTIKNNFSSEIKDFYKSLFAQEVNTFKEKTSGSSDGDSSFQNILEKLLTLPERWN